MVQGKEVLFTYTKDKEEHGWDWTVVNQEDGEVVENIKNIFIPFTGRVFSFDRIGKCATTITKHSKFHISKFTPSVYGIGTFYEASEVAF